MDYSCIHIHGHLLSDDLLHQIETDRNLQGNRDADFRLDSSLQEAIDYAWTSLRAAWNFYLTRSALNDEFGTRRSREFMAAFLLHLGYNAERQQTQVATEDGNLYPITMLCRDLGNFPIIVKGEGKESDLAGERCSLDTRTKSGRREKSAHATMLDYLNNTENIYGIVANGPVLRLVRNAGQLVKQTYIEFDLRRMFEEDKYAEFCVMFRVLHASRFLAGGDDRSIFERWFNLSIESGNRIREGLSKAAQRAMEIIGHAAVTGRGEGNSRLREALSDGSLSAETLSKELMHFIYRILFLFIIEDRNLVYGDDDSEAASRHREIYKKYYAASRFRVLSELGYVRSRRYSDLWLSLMDTFRLFEEEEFGANLGIKPLGGVLFNRDTLRWLKDCTLTNEAVFDAFRALNLFEDERGQMVRINYSSLDVEEFGSVYEGILEMRPSVTIGDGLAGGWSFGYVGGLDRQSTSSYYTRPDLVQSLIRTTLEPVIQERLKGLSTPEEKVASLLSMKVCDAASGSGHIVLAMARTIAWYVCSIRTGEDNPASMDFRRALHEVIERCVYAVDFNPDAVELCKVVLWIEGYCAGKPLSFLDHHIRCGNSVVGVTNLDMLLEGVPDKAFSAEDKDTLKAIKGLNKQAVADAKKLREKTSDYWATTSLFGGEYNITRIDGEQISLAEKVREITALPEDNLLQRLTKQSRWEDLMQSPRVESLRRACDIYTTAFYHTFTYDDVHAGEDGLTLPNSPYTATVYQALEEIKQLESPDAKYVPLSDGFKAEVAAEALRQRFFHWCVEFPEVFADGGGFDVMCGNPPWDKIKVEDKKWFEAHGRMDIVNAGTAAQRKKAIERLADSDPQLYGDYLQAQADAEAMSRFVRFGGRFPLTATGDIDLYPMFAELCLSFSKEAWGLVLPTGIAVNDSNKAFFSKLVDENRLVSLYDFENREKLFDIDSRFKFCLLTAGKGQTESRDVKGGFYLTRLDHLLDPNRIYTLRTSDFALLNPNTKTCPTFRTSRDAELTAKIYRNCGHIILNEATGDNPWQVKFGSMIHMSNDSHLFRTYAQLTEAGATLSGNRFTTPDGTEYVPLYEGKMIWHYNHHYGTWPTVGDRPNTIDSPSLAELQDPSSDIIPWYWIPAGEVKKNLMAKGWNTRILLAFRDITRAVDARTFVVAGVPHAFGVGHTATLAYSERSGVPGAALLAQLSSIPFDYVTRQKIGGTHASVNYVKQFPILAPDQIPDEVKWEMAKRVIELTYFNHDMDAWAAELWEEMTGEQRAQMPNVGRKEPFIFDPGRRAVLQAELDAIVARLFGLSEEDLRYILDPEDVCGPGCINETFRVLKERELRELGEYRTRRLVLDAWHRLPPLMSNPIS